MLETCRNGVLDSLVYCVTLTPAISLWSNDSVGNYTSRSSQSLRVFLYVGLQMLSLTGGTLESPVMGTMTELNAENAFSILSYMSIQVRHILGLWLRL